MGLTAGGRAGYWPPVQAVFRLATLGMLLVAVLVIAAGQRHACGQVAEHVPSISALKTHAAHAPGEDAREHAGAEDPETDDGDDDDDDDESTAPTHGASGALVAHHGLIGRADQPFLYECESRRPPVPPPQA